MAIRSVVCPAWLRSVSIRDVVVESLAFGDYELLDQRIVAAPTAFRHCIMTTRRWILPLLSTSEFVAMTSGVLGHTNHVDKWPMTGKPEEKKGFYFYRPSE